MNPERYNQEVKQVVLLLAGLAVLAGCNRGGIENKEAVRQGVIDYLAGRTSLNISSMDVSVTSVTFKGDEADATVTFAPRGATGAGQGMSMRYTLERKGNRWVVKGRGDSGNHGRGMGADPANPHSAMPPMPGGAGSPSPSGEMPPGHPPVSGSGKK